MLQCLRRQRILWRQRMSIGPYRGGAVGTPRSYGKRGGESANAHRIFALKRPAVCKDCGAQLPAGHAARYYGRYAIYGVGCHDEAKSPGNSIRTNIEPGNSVMV